MSNYNNLKTSIDANIKQNGNQEITGPILNSVLNQMVNILGTGYQFAGVATLDPATEPGTPDAKVFYIANGKGTYTNFGGIEVTEDDVVVLYWDTAWHKVATGIASQAKLSELESEVWDISNAVIDRKTESIKKAILGDMVFWVCLMVTLVLMLLGFYLPPMGEISPSVLQAVGWLFGFATLAKLCDTVNVAVKAGYDAKVQHGDTKIEINNH